jgi:hypothetical protein
MKRSKLQQQRYITRKNQIRHKRKVLRSHRNTSQARLNYRIPELRDDYSTSKKRSPIKKIELPSILSFLFSNENNFTSKKPHIPESGILTLPRIFSLTRNPEESYQFLKNLLYTLRFSDKKNIKINYGKCEKIELGASITMDIILKEFIQYFKELRNKHLNVPILSIVAININNEDVNKFLFSIGASNTIRGIHVNYPDVLTYPLKIGRKGINIGQKEVESTKLVEHIEKCLNKMNKTLNQESRENFADIIGEVLNNAEIHSSTENRFSIGHFEYPKNIKQEAGVFQFVIFNFGQSIYQRLNDPVACKNKIILKEMRQLSKKYTDKFLLGIGKDKIVEETLWTLYTLQDGVSCISPHRGNGTIRFIESFLELSGRDIDNVSNMNLLSGNSRIIFDGTYQTVEKINPSGEKHKIITFNTSSTLDDKPDEKYVKFVENFYPGMMLYAHIHIKQENLENE